MVTIRKDGSALMLVMLIASFVCTSTAPVQVSAQLEAEPLFTLHWVAPDSSPHSEIAQVIKQEFAKYGINIEIHIFDEATFEGRTWGLGRVATYEEGGSDLSLYQTFTMGSDYVWYLGMYSSGGIPPVGWQFWDWKNGVADKYLENAMSTYNRTERIMWIHLWQNECFEDAPNVFLYNPTRMNLFHIDLKGKHPFLQNSDVDLWTLDGKTPEDDVTLHLRLGSDAGTWLPWYIVHWNTLSMIYRGLYKQVWTEHGFDVAPDMIESYVLSEDGMTIEFKLRQDVKWHDGESFTSADVKFTYDMILNPDVGSFFNWDFSAAVKSVDAPDNYTVTLHLQKPTPEIFALLATTDASIVPKHVLENIPIEDLRTCSYNTEAPPPGTGPMKFVKWVRNEYVEYEAFDDFYLGRPFVDHIIQHVILDAMTALAALETGDLDAGNYYMSDEVQAEAERLRTEAPQLNTSEHEAVAATMITMNQRHPVLASRTVRKAISYMVPYDDIFEILYGFAEPISSYVPPNTWGFNPDTPYYTYDPEKAIELLREAGYPEWPPKKAEIPLSTYLIPAIGCLAVGVVIGFVANWTITRRKS